MAQKTEQLPKEILDNLVSYQNQVNELILNLGQIHLRIRELKFEIERLESVKAGVETESDKIGLEFNQVIKDLEKTYPQGEIDLKEGVVIFESAE
jgi:prefoldin subunit 5